MPTNNCEPISIFILIDRGKSQEHAYCFQDMDLELGARQQGTAEYTGRFLAESRPPDRMSEPKPSRHYLLRTISCSCNLIRSSTAANSHMIPEQYKAWITAGRSVLIVTVTVSSRTIISSMKSRFVDAIGLWSCLCPKRGILAMCLESHLGLINMHLNIIRISGRQCRQL